MEQSLTPPRVVARRTLSPFMRVHLAALAGTLLAYVYLQVALVGIFLPVPAALASITLGVMALVAMGWRWTPAVGTLWLFLVTGVGGDVITYHLARPENAHDFAFYVVVLGITFIGVVAGIAAVVRPIDDPRERPSWLLSLLVAVAMLCVGAILVVLIPRPERDARVSAAVAAELPVLATRNFAFDRAEMRARVGETIALRLENLDVATHSFDIDELDVHVPMRSGEATVALFRPTKPGAYTFYCSVLHHGEMRGALVVSP